MKLCKDCKHVVTPNLLFSLLWGHEYDKCGLTINAGSGIPQSHCSTERDPNYDFLGRTCGSEGQYWEEKG